MTTPIIIVLLLVSPLSVALVYAKLRHSTVDVRKYACWGVGIAFVFFSVGHFLKTDGMVQMLPPWVPYRVAIIYLTGVLEVFVGLALFFPKYRVGAAKAAIVMLVLFFPANIYAAMNSTGLGGHQWGISYLFIRGPLQLVLIAWTYFLCLRARS